MNINPQLIIAAAALTAACATPQLDAKNFEPDQKQIVVRAESPNYRPCPPRVSIECEMAVLEGNPGEEGLFTIRMRTDKPFVVRPHSHPSSERVTVLQGAINVGFGEEMDKNSGKRLVQGDYYVNKQGENHFVWSDEPVEIQITGLGPWELHFHE